MTDHLYKPQWDLRSDQIIEMETLIRRHRPESGVIAPARFIPLAEESSLIHPISEWILSSACCQGRQWLNREFDFGHIAVNFTGPKLQNGTLLDKTRGYY